MIRLLFRTVLIFFFIYLLYRELFSSFHSALSLFAPFKEAFRAIELFSELLLAVAPSLI